MFHERSQINMANLPQLESIEEFQQKAADVLEPSLNRYISGDHITQPNDNVRAFDKYLIRPYLACDTSHINTTTTILGCTVDIPLCIAPTWHRPGEDYLFASVAGKHNIGYTMSTWSSVRMEDLVERTPSGLKLFNLYIYKDRKWTEHVAKKAEENGFHALVLGFPKRQPGAKLDKRGGSRYANLEDLIPAGLTPEHPQYPMTDPASTWNDVTWLKSISNIPVIVKGVLSARDALHAVDAGADAILVSNHGGRQLDDVPAPIEVLAEVVHAVDKRCEVYMDGGVRSGASLFKALALGAKAVFIGRPTLWGHECGGAEGISKVVDIYKEQLKSTMMLAGVTDVQRIPGDAVVRRDSLSRL